MTERGGRLFWLGCALFGGFVVVALLAPQLAPYDPRLPVAQPFRPASGAHLLGTNDLGQDTFSQMLYGARGALIVVVAVTGISTVFSWLIGLTAGFVRPAEAPLMGMADLLLALPSLPLYMLVVTLIGPSRPNLILALAALSWPAFARMVRSVVLQERRAPYVEAAHALRAGRVHIAWRHLLPATLALLPTKLILTTRFAVFAEATLAFLGLAEGRASSWGAMLSWAFSDPLLFSRPSWPWLVLPPTLAIATLLLATTWISSGLPQRAVRRTKRAPQPHTVAAKSDSPVTPEPMAEAPRIAPGP